MLVGIIKEYNYIDILNKAKLHASEVDIFELRLDYIITHDLIELTNCLSNITKPVIITIRHSRDNGLYVGDEQARLDLISSIGQLQPDYIDIEEYVSLDYIKKLKEAYPQVEIIRSYHNYDIMPVDKLDTILHNMLDAYCSIYKIVGYAQSGLDCLRTIDFIKKISVMQPSVKIIAHCMGKLGEPSRVLGAIAGNYFTYASLNNSNIDDKLGIINITTMRQIYNIHKLQQNTQIFCLLGSPVQQSLGHVYHNDNFTVNNINAVYVKFDINQEELKDFVFLIKNNKDLNFVGFSVTMPLKQEITKYLDFNDNPYQLKIINTIKVINHKFYGTNTDGLGALQAIMATNMNAPGKSLCILGAGATATAIAMQAISNKLSVTIISRTLKKEGVLAQLLRVTEAKYLDIVEQDNILLLKKDFDFIINTLPFNVSAIEVLGQEYLLSDLIYKLSNNRTIFMDVNYNNDITIPNIICVAGYAMFEQQAKLQFSYWLNRKNNGD
jgi:3-dehydroquinate dehydratase/shikimate dehydrogenase